MKGEPGGARRGAVCVLVAVDDYAHPSFASLPGEKAAHNVRELTEVLTDDGREPAVEVRSRINPGHSDAIRDMLRPLAQSPPDLLVFYFMGHGYTDPKDLFEPEKLYLAMGSSSTARISHTGLAFRDLVDRLDAVRARRTVIILDCCRSGDFPQNALPDSRPFTVLTAAPKGFLISPGPHGQPLTPFTAALAQALRERPRMMSELGERLQELADGPDNRPRTPYMPWAPGEISQCGGGRTVLPPRAALAAVAASPEPSVPAVPVTPAPVPPSAGPVPEPEPDPPAPDPPVPDRPPRPRPRPPLRPMFLLGLTLALVVAAVGGVYALVGGGPAPHCPPPLELRMATAPDEVTPMGELVRDFENSPANHRSRGGAQDCRAARFTVYGASLDELTEHFGSPADWGRSASLTRVGPQPDIWVAESSEAVFRVSSDLPSDLSRKGFLRPPRTLMTDRPTLVLTDQARRRLSLPTAREEPGEVGWQRLRTALAALDDDDGVALFRPNPRGSGVGLAHVLGMYTADPPAAAERADPADPAEPADPGGALIPHTDITRLETRVISQSRAIAESPQALCGLKDSAPREAAGGGRADGALVSASQAERYAEDPVAYCAGVGAGAAGSGVHRYAVTGGPLLDHQLVEVAWPADDRDQRREATARFRAWAVSADGAGAARRLGYPPPGEPVPSLSHEDVIERLAHFRAAHPAIRLTVLFDVSGSMREHDRSDAAERAVRQALGRLGDSDAYRVTAFPTRRDGTGTEPSVQRWTETDGERVELNLPEFGDGKTGRQADLHAALRQTADEILAEEGDPDERHAVLLVTDGEFVEDRRPDPERLREIADRLGAREVPVVVASMRPYGCAADREAGQIAAGSGGECEPLSGELAAELARHVAALTDGGPPR